MMITTNLLIKSLTCLYLTIFLMTSQTLAFLSLSPKSKTHQDITRNAILQTTVDVCRSRALQDGKHLVLPGALTVASVAKACSSSDSAKDFQSSINDINQYNALVDVEYPFIGRYHFNNEEFWPGQDLITAGVSAVKNHAKQQNYQAARAMLGKTLHTLQDFYSHSDWIELGNRKSYTNLIKPDTLISNIADSETCRSCYGDGCSGNILEAVITQQKLTSGYFGPSKPNGKCSHGGEADLSSWGQGGINKDTPTSSHGHLHEEAALVATNATIELLDDIRAALGDSDFLRLLGLGKTSALCFVIDTTSSMSDDIAKLRKVTSAIINSKKGTAVQPLQYILVTFNDQDYGPLTRTMDPKVFQDEINALIPDGGGDDPEMCLSGLQLALTGSPVQTEIFVFTDADAKDKQLKHDVQALIETKKSVVTFILTRSTSSPSATPLYSQQQVSPQLVDIQLYQDLAQASGGYVIEVTNMNQASNTNEATSNSTMVTLFQTVRNPAKYETFPVFVDFSVQNLIIYIIGNSTDYTITSPTGVSKNSPILQSTETSWPIQGFDNLDIVQPNELEQAGLWHFSINSTQPYTIKVVGQSEIDFLYNFVQLFQGLHSSYAVLNSRPIANSNISLLLSMVGGDNLRPTKVSVVNATSSNYFPGKLVKIGSGQYLVNFSSIPTGEFTIRVDGEASFLSNVILKFQRQSSTRFQTSKVIITAPPSERIEPGKQVTLPFRVATDGSGGRFNIRVSNDHNFDTSFNTSITLESGGSANGTVTLTAPTNASSGTEVSVTIQAEAADGSDFNYVVLRLAVDAPAKDFIPPMCTIVSINADCPGDCRNSSWDLTAEVTGGFGSNIPSVRVLQGNGKLIITSILNDTGIVTTVVYTSSCCFPELELVAIDEVGNVVTCFKSPSAIAASRILTSGVEFFLVLPFKPLSLWLNMGVSLYQFMQL
ncbi:von Willebrand factor A domain-containing protein 7 isoform X1 [Ictalurus punctatus]|uniref:von Willebrand factor A domain-containing protein 7 isoform X1 n=1 Tax=Ictalurus punctatus TaxID=7998 RepID=A0A2D0QK62_ICTPU|nr:von Willebrand factor A domain-containing protein 7 isoform X1 [Ictalurus punctatus]